jgi:hypothetical protein
MGKAQRSKGARGELEFAHALADALGVPAERRGMYQAQASVSKVPDVDWPGCPWWLECKRGAKPNHRAALGQAITDSGLHGQGRVPVVIARDDRAEAIVVMRFADWLDMAKVVLEEE